MLVKGSTRLVGIWRHEFDRQLTQLLHSLLGADGEDRG
jgi:hypothetical protein